MIGVFVILDADLTFFSTDSDGKDFWLDLFNTGCLVVLPPNESMTFMENYRDTSHYESQLQDS